MYNKVSGLLYKRRLGIKLINILFIIYTTIQTMEVLQFLTMTYQNIRFESYKNQHPSRRFCTTSEIQMQISKTTKNNNKHQYCLPNHVYKHTNSLTNIQKLILMFKFTNRHHNNVLVSYRFIQISARQPLKMLH